MLGALSVARARLWLVLIALGFSGSIAAQGTVYYKWTDAAGTVHVSATPPPSGKATVVRIDDAAQGPAKPATLPAPPTAPGLDQALVAYRQQSCAAARHDLKLLHGSGMVVTSGSPDAATKLSAAERAQATTRAQQRMAQFCQTGKRP